MKANFEVNAKVVRELGCVPAVVLGVINQAAEPLSVAEVSHVIGLTFPTVAKALGKLAEANLVKQSGDFNKRYSKN